MVTERVSLDEVEEWARREQAVAERYRRIMEEAGTSRAAVTTNPLLAFGCATLARLQARMAG